MEEGVKLKVSVDILHQLYNLFSKQLDDTVCNCKGHRKCTVRETCLRYAIGKADKLSEYYHTCGNTDDENCPNYLPIYIKL